MKCVVLAGGGGLRLWPLSREKYPKQFLAITSGNTMFTETILRNRHVSEKFMILTNDNYRFIVEDQMRILQMDDYELILETVGRNTAPAIALACFRSISEELLLVVPADASIEGIMEYQDSIKKASRLASEGYIVTFGIKPDKPHTGYGYIRHLGCNVLSFKEKPDYETAVKYLESGDYLWNSGMFLFNPEVFLSELLKYCPEVYNECKRISDILNTQKVAYLPKEYMENIPPISVDYAVMEKSDRIKVIPVGFKWSDVGCLEAMTECIRPDNDGNRISGENIILKGAVNTRVLNKAKDQLIVVNGVDNAIVVNTMDALYVSALGKSSDIKEIIDISKDIFGRYYEQNYIVHRPWGCYEILKNNHGYRVRRITVNPHKRLSLHKHVGRSEHWIIVAGTATVIIDDGSYIVESKQSIDIPTGSIHRLCNDTDKMLEIIEISLGESLSEDDIMVFEDDFDRFK